MWPMRFAPTVVLVALLAPASPVRADPAASDFRPDPRSVQRYGPAYRYPQAGWIVLHIEGAPYDRGYQHGRLLAQELVEFLRCSAALQSPTAPADGWKVTRSLVNALFVRRYEREFLEEMKGIADGATAAGARFEGRPIDVVDIVALNAWPEVETLDSALEATPTGLEGIRFPHQQPRTMPDPKPMHCSAFAATGPATADGKVVFGHITMFGLYPSLFYNVWLDIKPADGHRVLMQTYPGGIQSGLDYYMNDAGLVVCETTIAQTRFDITGMSLASRIRQTLQYADSIDRAVEILQKGNNGLYTNEWLLADVKTNEIAMLELGTAKTKLYRSSKNEWFGGAEGFYWGCNNTKDLDVRLETLPGVNAAPANVVWHPSDRDKTWMKLYQEHKGQIDADFGKLAFTTPPVAAYHSLDAKFTTTELAKDLKTWALFGPPLGRTWEPTDEEKRKYSEVRGMVSNPWTILHVNPPTVEVATGPVPVDLPDRIDGRADEHAREENRRTPAPVPAWHGTLLAKTDADVWLAAAFSDYEKIVSHEKALRERAHDAKLTADDRDRLAVRFFANRAGYAAGARAGGDVPLSKIQTRLDDSEWYRVAAGKGVMLLHALRQRLGDEHFETLMNTFGKAHAGKEVTSEEFIHAAEQTAGKPLKEFFDQWLTRTELPILSLGPVEVTKQDAKYRIQGVIHARDALPGTPVQLAIETPAGETMKQVILEGADSRFSTEVTQRPRRVTLNKYGEMTQGNGAAYSITTFYNELPSTLIVYGTADEAATNREAAEGLQRALLQSGPNITVPIKSEQEVDEDELKSHHLILIGRPDSNHLVQRYRDTLPVTFGSRSFSVRGDHYAHARSAVVAAGPNLLDPRYSVVVIAGLSAEATRTAASQWLRRGGEAAQVFVLPHHGKHKALVVPAPECVRDLASDSTKDAATR